MSDEHLAKTKLNAVGKWHGGKGAFNGKLAKWIISLIPKHTHYVEPYFGMGSVLLNKDPEGISEVVNDIHKGLTDMWYCLSNPSCFKDFVRIVQAIPFSETEFTACGDEWNIRYQGVPIIESAIKFFVRARQSRQGLMKDFATLSRNRTRRGMNEQVSSWLTAIEGLPDVHARLKRVVVLNRPALDVIRQQDGLETCLYLDPPYVSETRETTSDYAHEMTLHDHNELLQTLAGVKGKFLLSGYRHALYDDQAKRCGWNRHEFEIVNNASSKAVKEVKTECVWVNF